VRILQNDNECNTDKNERIIIPESDDDVTVIRESWLQSTYSFEYQSRWSAGRRQVSRARINSWSMDRLKFARCRKAGVRFPDRGDGLN